MTDVEEVEAAVREDHLPALGALVLKLQGEFFRPEDFIGCSAPVSGEGGFDFGNSDRCRPYLADDEARAQVGHPHGFFGGDPLEEGEAEEGGCRVAGAGYVVDIEGAGGFVGDSPPLFE